ncbi:MAG: SO_0444 family Cu/Zn efflux transporter [Lentisphaeria bacterium]|nr:SO_0444 family Cu/Zn efflux transporter [Lentisphaeria bacterium]
MTYILTTLVEIWRTLGEMAPYLLLGFLAAGVLSRFVTEDFVRNHLGKGFRGVLLASLLGVPLPLCSCGVIPVAASLRLQGAGKGATTAFLLSTPQTGVDSILATLGMLGPVFAVFRPIIAFVSGLLGGTVVELFDPEDDNVLPETTQTVPGEEATVPGETLEACCSNLGDKTKPSWLAAAQYGLVELPASIRAPLAIGIVIAGALSAALPDTLAPELLGGGMLAMLAMMVAGIPMYVCATASVPIAAVLLGKGVSPGAVLVFLMTGPATNAATIGVVWRTLGKRSAIAYLSTVVVTALGAGWLLDHIFLMEGMQTNMGAVAMLPGWAADLSALLLLGVLLLPTAFAHTQRDGSEMANEGIELHIKGMTCEHCAASVQEALSACPGVVTAHVSQVEESAMAIGRDAIANDLQQAVETLGFKVVDITIRQNMTEDA